MIFVYWFTTIDKIYQSLKFKFLIAVDDDNKRKFIDRFQKPNISLLFSMVNDAQTIQTFHRYWTKSSEMNMIL